MERINIADKFARFSEQWQPKIVAQVNGQEVSRRLPEYRDPFGIA